MNNTLKAYHVLSQGQRSERILGSGAIESVIRRVINLRMKGNSIFWKEENAEAMLTLRGLVLSGRWKTTFEKTNDLAQRF